MKRGNSCQALTVGLLISLLLTASYACLRAEAATYTFTAAISPTQVTANQLVIFTVTVTDTGTSRLGSTTISIPAGFTVFEPIQPTYPTAFWTASSTPSTISVTATGGNGALNTGEYVTFTFAAVALTSSGVTTWTTTAFSGVSGGGTALNNTGPQPTVIVNNNPPLVAPTISASPSTINQGQTSTLIQYVNPSGGTTPYTYQWSQSHNAEPFSPIPGANGPTCTFSTTTSTATGAWSFRLTVNDSSYIPSTVTSTPVNVNLNAALAAPTLTAIPDIVNQTQTSTITSSAITTGTSPYTYQWYQKAPSGQYATVGTSSPDYTFPGTTIIGVWTFLLQVTDSASTSINSTETSLTVTSAPSFTITVIQAPHGTISPGTTTVVQGASQTFTIIPDPGYQVENAIADGSPVGALTSFTFTNVNVDHTLTATFTQIEYTLTVSTVGSGTATAAPSQSTYHYGDVVQLTATPASGWSFSGWSGDFYRTTNPINIIINGTTSVTATFTENTFTLTISTTGSGTVTRSPDQTSYHLGDSVTLTATPSADWSFGGWTGDITTTSDPVSIIINGTTSVTATFVQNTYPLTISTVGSGSVAASPNQALYHSGDIVQLTANPAAGWSFSTWSGTFSSSQNPISIIINGSTSVTATFVQNGYTLSLSTIGSGSVARTPDQASYHLGDVVTLTASPATGWNFNGWSGSLSGSQNPVSIIINGTTAVTATFTQNTYTLTIHTVGNGIVTMNNTGPYQLGDTIRLTATANPTWVFSSWTGNFTSSANPADLTINGTMTVTATFTQNAFYLTISTLGNGSVLKVPDQAIYRSGDVVQLTATPSSGWRFAGWNGSLTGSANPSSITINSNATVTAIFLVNQYMITASAGPGGAISPSGTTIVDYAGGQTYSIAPNMGYHVADVTLNGTSIGPVRSYTISNVTGDTIIAASFAGDYLTIESSAGPHGRISPSGAILIDWNGTLTFTITPDANYHIENVIVDGASAGAVDTYTFAYITANHTINAEFAQNPLSSFSITVTSPHGNPTVSTQVNAGDSLTVSVTSIEGDANHRWICTGFSVDGGTLASGASYTFTNVQANHAIVFNWQEQYHLTVNTQVGVASGEGWYNTGATATASISSTTITDQSATRHIFTGWSGDASGTASTSNPITMNGPKTATANWKTQYYLTVTSAMGNPTGQGWYDAGTIATINVEPPASNSSDTRIILNWRGTSGGYTGAEISATITMNGAVIEEAIWTTQYLVTYKLTTALQIEPPQTEWINSGTRATSAFVATTTNPAGNVRSIFVSDDRPTTVTAPTTVTGIYKTQYVVQFSQNGLTSNITGTVATVLGELKAYDQLPTTAWIDQGGSLTFVFETSLETPNGEKYVLKNANSTSPLTINEPMTILAEYTLEVPQSAFNLQTIGLAALVICSLSLAPVPVVMLRRRKTIITPIAGEGGYISPSTAQKIERNGSSTVFIITARYGYKIKDVIIDNKTHLGAVRTYKFTDVNESHTITAEFSRS